MPHRLRAFIAVLIAGCAAEEHDFSLSFTFKGDVCGGLDLLGRRRVAKIDYQIFSPADPANPIHSATVPCSEEPVLLTLDPVGHRVVVAGIGDDGNRCWDTGPLGVLIAPTEDGSVTIDVPQVCVLNDAVRLTIEVIGPGEVISEPGGIDCPSVSCVGVYDRYAGVRLRARPKPGAEFAEWKACGGSQESVTLPMFANRECKAIFVDPARSDWSEAHPILGPSFTAPWSATIEGGGPAVVYAEGSATIGLSRARAIPDAAGDWQHGAILDAGDATLGSPNIAVDASRTWVTANFANGSGCGVTISSRRSTDDAFEVLREIPLAPAPCSASTGRALASNGRGTLFLATSDERAISVHLFEAGESTSVTVFDLPSAGALRGTSNFIIAEGRPAFAFSIFDRATEQGRIWIAAARNARPIAREDWNVHPVYVSDRTPEAPALIADGDRFMITFGTVEGLGRETERRSQHLAMSLNLDPQTSSDWITVIADETRGGPASILRHGTDLVIAYGHTDVASGTNALIVATSEESSPFGPQDFTARELDRTALIARPQLFEIGATIAIIYAQGPNNGLVFRSTDAR